MYFSQKSLVIIGNQKVTMDIVNLIETHEMTLQYSH